MLGHSVNRERAEQPGEAKLRLFIIAYFIVQIVNMLIKNVFPVGASGPIISAAFMGLLFLLMLFTAGRMLKRCGVAFLAAEAVMVVLFAISYLLGYADTALLLDNALWCMGVCTPLAFYIMAIRDFDALYASMLRASYVMSGLLLLLLLFSRSAATYNMSFAYALLLPTLLHVTEYFSRRKVRYLIISLAEVAALLLYGSRGVIFCIAVLVVTKLLFSPIRLSFRLLLSAIMIACAVLFHLYSERIGTQILHWMSSKGLYSRTLVALFSGNIGTSIARQELRRYYFDLIAQRPLLGWGILGGWIGEGNGPHNMLVELLLAFGLPVGGLLCIGTFLPLRSVFMRGDSALKKLLDVFVAICSVMYLFAGNMLMSVHLFIMFALYARFISVRRSAKNGSHQTV